MKKFWNRIKDEYQAYVNAYSAEQVKRIEYVWSQTFIRYQ